MAMKIASRRSVLRVATAALLLGPTRLVRAADRRKRVTVALAADILSLDPMNDTTINGLNVQLNVFDTLTSIAADASVIPRIALRLEASPDATVWTVTIRSGVKFHNGDLLTVDDVLWTYQSVLGNPKSSQRPYLSRVRTMEKIGSDQIRFTLNAAFVPFDRQLSLIAILPEKAYRAAGADFALKPVGSGPFKVVRWIKDTRIELIANPDYWDGTPKLDEVVFVPIPAEAARASALTSGQVDIVPILPPSMLTQVARDGSIHVEPVESNRAAFLGFNHTHPALANLKVRQAIDCAIDRGKITQALLRGYGKPIGQVGAPVIFGYDPAIAATTYDPAKAKAMVAESGYKGEKIVLDYPTNRLAFGDQVAQAIGGYLQAAGLNIELRGAEFASFFPNWLGNKFSGIFLYGIGISVMDADLLVGFQYESGLSHGYWNSPEVDDLIRRQRAAADPAERKALLSKIWTISKESVVYAPLYVEIQAYGIRKGITFKPRADERLRFIDADAQPT
jgi:peptide/nickel transport system substrate-binding protein